MDLQKLEQIKALRAKYRVGDSDEKALGTSIALGLGANYLAGKLAHHLLNKKDADREPSLPRDPSKPIRIHGEDIDPKFNARKLKVPALQDPRRILAEPHGARDLKIAAKETARSQSARKWGDAQRGADKAKLPPLLTPRKDRKPASEAPKIHTRGGREGAQAVMGELQKQGNVKTRGRMDNEGRQKYETSAGRPVERGHLKLSLGKAKPINSKGNVRQEDSYTLKHRSGEQSPSKPSVKPTAADFTSSADKPVDIPEKLDVHSEHRGGDVTRSGGEIHRLESAPKESTYQAPPPVRRETKDPLQNLTSPHHRRDRAVVPYVSPRGSPPSSTRPAQSSPVQEGQEESGPVVENKKPRKSKRQRDKEYAEEAQSQMSSSGERVPLDTGGDARYVAERKNPKARPPRPLGYDVTNYPGEETSSTNAELTPQQKREKLAEQVRKTRAKYDAGKQGTSVAYKVPGKHPVYLPSEKEVSKLGKKRKKSFDDVEEKAMDIDTKAAKKKPIPKELQGLPRSAVTTRGVKEDKERGIARQESRPLTRAEQKLVRGPARTTGSTKREIPRGTTNLGPLARRSEETPEQIAAINAANAEIERTERDKKKPKEAKKPKVYPAVTPSSGSSKDRLVNDPGVLSYNKEHLEVGLSRGKPKSAAYSPHVTDAPSRNVEVQHARMRGIPDDSGATRFQSQRGVPQAGGIGRSRVIQQRATAGPLSGSQLSEIGLRGRAESGKMRDTANKFEGMSISRGQARAASEAGTTQRGRTRAQIDKDNWEAGIPKGPSTTDKIKAKLGQKPAAPVNTYGTYGPHLMGNTDNRTAHKARNIKVDYGAHKHMTIQNKADSFADRIGLVKAARRKPTVLSYGDVGPKTYPTTGATKVGKQTNIPTIKKPRGANTAQYGGMSPQQTTRLIHLPRQAVQETGPRGGQEMGHHFNRRELQMSRGIQETGPRGGQEMSIGFRGDLGRETSPRGGQETGPVGGASRPMRSIGMERVYPNFTGTRISREQARRMGHADITHTSGKHLSDDQTRAEKFMGRLARKNQDKSNNLGSLGAAGGLESMAEMI